MQQMKYFFKKCFIAVPWIGNVGAGLQFIQIAQKHEPDIGIPRFHLFQMPEVVLIHRHQKIKVVEVFPAYLTCAVPDFQPMLLGILQGAPVRLFTAVVAAGSGAVATEQVCCAQVIRVCQKMCFRKRRATNIPQANKKNSGHIHPISVLLLPRVLQPFLEPQDCKKRILAVSTANGMIYFFMSD